MTAESKEYDYIFKITMIGDCGVGKSNLMLRFADNEFVGDYRTTIGVDFKIRTIELGGKVIKLQIWDTAGTEQFRSLCSNYYRNAHGIVLVYDCTSLRSFTNIKDIWLKEIEKGPAPEDVHKVLIGNKCDLVSGKVVTTSMAEDFANTHKILFLEASAKDATNVQEAFIEMAQLIMNSLQSQEQLEPATLIRIHDERAAEPGYLEYYGCCSS